VEIPGPLAKGGKKSPPIVTRGGRFFWGKKNPEGWGRRTQPLLKGGKLLGACWGRKKTGEWVWKREMRGEKKVILRYSGEKGKHYILARGGGGIHFSDGGA